MFTPDNPLKGAAQTAISAAMTRQQIANLGLQNVNLAKTADNIAMDTALKSSQHAVNNATELKVMSDTVSPNDNGSNVASSIARQQLAKLAAETTLTSNSAKGVASEKCGEGRSCQFVQFGSRCFVG